MFNKPNIVYIGVWLCKGDNKKNKKKLSRMPHDFLKIYNESRTTNSL
jgi:hypothetical protein